MPTRAEGKRPVRTGGLPRRGREAAGRARGAGGGARPGGLRLALAGLVFCLGWCGGAAHALLYDYEFETGNTSEFSRTAGDFAGDETGVVRKGNDSGRMRLALSSQTAYVEAVLDPPLADVHVKCALRLGSDVEVFLRGELLSLLASDPRTPAASLTVDRDLRLELVTCDAAGRLASVPASGVVGPLEPGRWYDLELHFRSGLHPDGGLLEVFLDGVKTAETRPGSTQSLAGSVCYGQRMAWLAGSRAVGTVYYDICKGSRTGPIGQEPDKLAVVLVDRSPAGQASYDAYASERVKGFLDHVGLPYLELDAGSVEIAPEALRPFDLVILGQEGGGDFLAPGEQDAVAETVERGAGLVVLDPWLDRYRSPAFQEMLGGVGWDGEGAARSLEVPATDHFITALQPADPARRRYAWTDPVPQLALADPGRNQVLAETEQGPAVLAGSYGAGRVCSWLLSTLLWDGEVGAADFRYLGHVHGLDDLLWRGLVWACRKPMAWQPIAGNLLAMKVDDCRGRSFGGTPFEYLEMASDALGVPVHASLFLDAIGEAQAEPLQGLQALGKADVSAHAFDGGDTDPHELSRWQIYWDLPNNQPFPPLDLAGRWARVDDFFDRHGLAFSSLLAPSFAVAGVGNLPYLDAHGMVFANTINDFGTTAGTGLNSWPGSRPFRNGIHALDFMGGGAGPFNVSNWADYHFYSYDYLVRFGVFPYEAVQSPQEGMENAARQMRFAFGARFPMILLTHEYVMEVAGFDLEDWSTFLGLLGGVVGAQGASPRGPAELAANARDYVASRIISYVKGSWKISLLLEGTTEGSTAVEAWFGEEGPALVAVPAFRESRHVEVITGAPPPAPAGDGGGCGCSLLAAGGEGGAVSSRWMALLPPLLAGGWVRVLKRRTRALRIPRGRGRRG